MNPSTLTSDIEERLSGDDAIHCGIVRFSLLMLWRGLRTSWHLSILLIALVSAVGCGRGPKTHTVKGNIVVDGGEVAHLAGSHIEAALTSDPTLRASGVIQDDGSFKLETHHVGSNVSGAREGSYQARIILADDDKELRKKASQTVAARFRDFKTSGLIFEVPATGPVTLVVAPR